jgi:hypothetical protein
MTRLLPVAALLGCALIAGCGDGRVTVRGTVKLDGKPVPNGVIHFKPADAKHGNAGAPILNGEYEIPLPNSLQSGSFGVSINWPVPTGKKIPNPYPNEPEKFIDETREAMPAKFNTQTTLSADFRSGDNVVNFDLTSK